MSETHLPPPIKPGDTIGVFAPSSWVEAEDINKSRNFLEERGYKVVIHPQTLLREHQFAGSLHQKAEALVSLWHDPDIHCIWAAGGGNRCLHLLDHLDPSQFQSPPKPLVGFSDVTALLNTLYACNGIIGYHGPTFNRLWRCPQRDQALSMLEGRFEDSLMPLDGAIIINEGHGNGPLIGGNLSLFHYLPYTVPGYFWRSGILFIEDCNEELSRIDRMMLQLKRTGVLSEISGLICGQFTPVLDSGKPYGLGLEDIIREHTAGLDIPVIMNAPFGHSADLYTLPVGKKIRMDATKGAASLSFE